MASTFTPSTAIDTTKEKDWASNLGLLDWDSTSIVFTKRSLVEFLKYTGTTVDPSFANIQKLPRYAKFGKLSEGVAEDTTATTTTATEVVNASDEFKPTRRVRTVPGGPHTDIFAHDEEDDALATAPPRAGVTETNTASVTASVPSEIPEEEESGINFASSFKPSRRVRTTPGGQSSMSNLWDPEVIVEEFKPTRRVRQGPGGQDHINGIF